VLGSSSDQKTTPPFPANCVPFAQDKTAQGLPEGSSRNKEPIERQSTKKADAWSELGKEHWGERERLDRVLSGAHAVRWESSGNSLPSVSDPSSPH
jgi:hypothetical protein